MKKEEDLGLPKQTIVKRARKNQPKVFLNADVQDLLVTCSTEFVRLITSEANEAAKNAGKTTITPEFIIEACKRLGFESYAEHLRNVANSFSDDVKEKRDKKKSSQNAISQEERARLQELMFAEAAAEYDAGYYAKKEDEEKKQ